MGEPAEGDFVVEGELTNDSSEPRKIRVYDPNGDFFLEVPPGIRMTFGYFNPKPHADSGDRYNHRPSDVARATALRIYADTTDKKQLACFLGVTGFKDEAIHLTRIVQRVTVETTLINDGDGTIEYGSKQAKQLRAIPEQTTYGDDEQPPF